jgi:AGZA family xanthine/uracil permease-like MFS transporter
LTSVVVALLFFAALFLSSLAGTIPPQATAPVLLMVGYFMMTIVREISWGNPEIGIPALLVILVQPLTFSITNGVGAGFIAYTVIQLLNGNGFRDLAFAVNAVSQNNWGAFKERAWKLHPLMLVVSGVFGWYFWKGLLP